MIRYRYGFLILMLLGLAAPGALAEHKAQKTIAQLEFRDISVGDALRILSAQSHLNIIASEQAAKIPMTLYLHDITPKAALDAIAKTYNLWYQHDPGSNVIRVYTVREFRLGQVDYQNEKTKIYTFKHERNSLDFAYLIQDLFGFERVRLSQGSDESQILFNLSNRLNRFDIIARNTMDLGGIMSGGGGGNNNTNQGGNSRGGGGSGGFGISGGGAGGGNQQFGNQGFGNQSSGNRRSGNQGFGNQGFNQNRQGQNRDDSLLDPNKLADIQKLLPETEAQGILSGEQGAGQAMLNQLLPRLSPIYVTMIRTQNRVLVRTRDKDVINELDNLHDSLDPQLQTVLLEVKLLEVDLNDGYDQVFDFSYVGNKQQASSFTGAVDNGPEQLLPLLAQSGLAVASPALVATHLGSKFQARIELLEREGRVTTLATPMLTTVNQEVSRIFLGEQRPITTDINVVCSQSTTTGSGIVNAGTCRDEAQTDTLPIGRTLLLTPNINSDGTVSIRLLVEESTPCIKCATIPTQDGEKEVDTVQQKTFGGTIVASNGEMIAVGGLIQESASDREDKVPILGDIPLLGLLFTDLASSRQRTELVILLRPLVMDNGQQRVQTSRDWLERNTTHPAAGDDTMAMYGNPDRSHKGYVLENPYKEYRGQDTMDPYLGKGDSRRFPNAPQVDEITAKHQLYMRLTQYASEAVRLTPEQRPPEPGIVTEALAFSYRPLQISQDSRLKILPVASWRQGGVHVTALEVHNTARQTVPLRQDQFQGQWLAATLESEQLAADGELGDSTYLYLISAVPFAEALGSAAP